jgi:hypothetical protein
MVQSLGEICRNSEERLSRTKPTKPLVNVMRANRMCKVGRVGIRNLAIVIVSQSDTSVATKIITWRGRDS